MALSAGVLVASDMLEVGRLKNYSESRTHFSAWAVMSSPLILSFDLRVDKVRALAACVLSAGCMLACL